MRPIRQGTPAPGDTAGFRLRKILVATHRRAGVARLVKGSVAERVERATTVPVVLVPHGVPEESVR
jgi:hypothetical protein